MGAIGLGVPGKGGCLLGDVLEVAVPTQDTITSPDCVDCSDTAWGVGVIVQLRMRRGRGEGQKTGGSISLGAVPEGASAVWV